MRILGNGAGYVTVSVSRREVAEFRAHWPCSGLKDSAYRFTFDKRNGDLLDVRGETGNETADALEALSQDAQKFAGL